MSGMLGFPVPAPLGFGTPNPRARLLPNNGW